MAAARVKFWLRFDLRFLLFWLIPYVAIAAAVLSWPGPYLSPFLNQHVRLTLVIALTVLWLSLLASAQARKEQLRPSAPSAD